MSLLGHPTIDSLVWYTFSIMNPFPSSSSQDRPWGNRLELVRNTPVTVVVLTVNPGEALSLQYHHNRAEYWYVLSGSGTVTVGEEHFPATAGKEYHIPQGVLHRISAETESLRILEISTGTYEDEDIIRTEDKYGRTTPNSQ